MHKEKKTPTEYHSVGDDDAAELERAHYHARNEESAERIVLCLDCHVPMVQIAAGLWRCPFDRPAPTATSRRG